MGKGVFPDFKDLGDSTWWETVVQKIEGSVFSGDMRSHRWETRVLVPVGSSLRETPDPHLRDEQEAVPPSSKKGLW